MANDGSMAIAGRSIFSGEPVTVTTDAGVIASVEPLTASDDAALAWIGPGLVDLQINGFAGIDVNGDELAVRADDLVDALQRVGVTTFLPTVITATADAIDARLRVIAGLMRESPRWRAAVAGVHLEGPFISPEDGPRGAHPAAAVRPPDWDRFRRWQDAAEGAIRLITLSPEWPGAVDFIRHCREAGVIVAIGHTAATPEQIQEAVAAGATLSTHFGNGAHPVLPRHPNYLWEQLANDALWASVIADGFHLPDAVLKTVIRMKGERAVLVSDSVALAGMPPGAYESPVGDRVVLTEQGRLHLAADPRLLAGSAQPLIAGISHLIQAGLATPGEAWSMASMRPGALLGSQEVGEIAPGGPADLVLVDLIDGDIQIRQVVKSGHSVFEQAHQRFGEPETGAGANRHRGLRADRPDPSGGAGRPGGCPSRGGVAAGAPA
jgi:N-acetylglucosamine-6-phosphate deacetylase